MPMQQGSGSERAVPVSSGRAELLRHRMDGAVQETTGS